MIHAFFYASVWLHFLFSIKNVNWLLKKLLYFYFYFGTRTFILKDKELKYFLFYIV